MIDRQSRESEVTEQMLHEFFDRGGTITVCPPGERSEEIDYKGSGFYGNKKKKADNK